MNTHRAGVRRANGKLQCIHSGSEQSCKSAIKRHAAKHGNDLDKDYEVIFHIEPIGIPKGWVTTG